jgi:Cyclic nucleotide-binding domain
MRIDSSVTSVSWIPSEVVPGLAKAGFTSGAMHYDDPPPDRITDLAALAAAERFRFANHLAAWIEIADGRIVDAGYSGRGYISHTRMRLGGRAELSFAPAEFPELRAEPRLSSTEATFEQTTGGKTGLPFPRPVRGKPFFKWAAPTVWTTLRLTIRADGPAAREVVGASGFPRHWIYDEQGQLVAKSGLASFADWARTAFGQHTPWGDENSRPVISAAETALEREISATIMRGGARPSVRKLASGAVLAEQDQPGRELYLLLDGIITVLVNGSQVAELGPGAVLGERAVLENGRRTASLVALTDCVVAVATADQVDRDSLAALAAGHRREEPAAAPSDASSQG